MSNPVDKSLQNPWKNLSPKPPYVLAEDMSIIERSRHAKELRIDTLPDPFVGGLDSAEVIFLALNPGFIDSDIELNLKMPEFLEANRTNLNDPYSSPFYYFSGSFEETGGHIWWERKLKPLLQAGITESVLREKIMLIEYLGYHSKNADKIKGLKVPSQHFSFNLVREAISRQKTIVIMRSKKLWLEAVPELDAYPYMTLNSSLNVTISPKNIGEANFEIILKKLTNKEPREN
ncbi:MAG: hypothetical protein JWO99_392 [Candidatus Saccharibacteria bacterium]|nr:hypothetical protein [Candidatus Saccharibacteria bacterium]